MNAKERVEICKELNPQHLRGENIHSTPRGPSPFGDSRIRQIFLVDLWASSKMDVKVIYREIWKIYRGFKGDL